MDLQKLIEDKMKEIEAQEKKLDKLKSELDNLKEEKKKEVDKILMDSLLKGMLNTPKPPKD